MNRSIFQASFGKFRNNPKQIECLKRWFNPNGIREIYYGGAKMCGKSYLGAFIILFQAFRYPKTHYFVARKRITDLTKMTVPTFQEVGINFNIHFNFDRSRNIITLPNESRIFFIDAQYLPSDPWFQRYGSMQMTQGWIEEAGEVSFQAKSNLQASIGRWKNETYGIPIKILLTCNPSDNFIFDVYRAYSSDSLADDISFIPALPTDNPFCSPEYLDNLRSALSFEDAQRLLYGRWEFTSETNLFHFSNLSSSFQNEIPVIQEVTTNYLAVDVALQGKDRCVISLMFYAGGKGVVVILSDEKQETSQSILDKIRTYQQRYAVYSQNTIIDATGVGASLSEFITDSYPFHAGGKSSKTFGYPTQKLYRNARVECLYLLARMVNDNCITFIANDKQKERMMREFTSVHRVNSSEAFLDATPKDELKEKVGGSTDYLDSCYMLFARLAGAYRQQTVRVYGS